MMYGLSIGSKAKRDFRALAERAPRHDIERLYITVENLVHEPRPHGVQQVRGRDRVYRVRVGNYRVIYEVDDKENIVLISRVLRRNEATYRA